MEELDVMTRDFWERNIEESDSAYKELKEACWRIHIC